MTGNYESAPAEFQSAASQVLHAPLRSELTVKEIPAPERIAPYTLALAAGIDSTLPDIDAIESPAGAGRLILLYDPQSKAEWGGKFRIVCYAQAPLEMEIGLDPFIADVAWSWLVDALDSRSAEYTYVSGTATKTLSTGFGTLASQGSGAQLELRASWTPTGDNFGAHAEAWSELLCLLAGFPHEEGAASLSAKRAERKTDKGDA